MRFTIFHRLVLGYLAIILIMGATDAYTVTKLHRLNKEASRILSLDEHLLKLNQKISASIICQSGYEKKYVITRDPAFHKQLLACEKDFHDYLAQALSLADSPEKRKSLALVQSHYDDYQLLASKETGFPQSRQPPPNAKEAQEKENALNLILRELDTLEALSASDRHNGMSMLRDAAGSAGRVTIFMVAATIVLAVGISVMVTHSIANPLKTLMEKTKEVSKGIFKGELHIESPPEVSELARTFDIMCEKLGQLDKTKSEFFSTISHELRTPITAIKTGVSLLRQDMGERIPDRQQRLFLILSKESNRLIDLVNSVLDLSKMEAGMMAYRFHQEHLTTLIEQVLAEMVPLFEAKKIRLETDLAADMPPLQLDRERILQAVRNLVGNALKYTPEGGHIWVTSGPRDRSVVFSVKDTGPGISEENLDAVFEKFHQVNSKGPTLVKGTGLGLALVKHIITSHGGKVWAESKVGEGSVFTFALPF